VILYFRCTSGTERHCPFSRAGRFGIHGLRVCPFQLLLSWGCRNSPTAGSNSVGAKHGLTRSIRSLLIALRHQCRRAALLIAADQRRSELSLLQAKRRHRCKEHGRKQRTRPAHPSTPRIVGQPQGKPRPTRSGALFRNLWLRPETTPGEHPFRGRTTHAAALHFPCPLTFTSKAWAFTLLARRCPFPHNHAHLDPWLCRFQRKMQ